MSYPAFAEFEQRLTHGVDMCAFIAEHPATFPG